MGEFFKFINRFDRPRRRWFGLRMLILASMLAVIWIRSLVVCDEIWFHTSSDSTHAFVSTDSSIIWERRSGVDFPDDSSPLYVGQTRAIQDGTGIGINVDSVLANVLMALPLMMMRRSIKLIGVLRIGRLSFPSRWFAPFCSSGRSAAPSRT
jgi:hypothetical protein